MKTTGLDFIEAMQAASEGKKIRRACWTRGEYVYFNDDNGVFVYGNGRTESLKTLPRNILADDWEIVPEPPKTMTFQEAVEHLQEHRGVVKRQDSCLYMQIRDNVLRIFRRGSGGAFDVLLDIDAIQATDWIAVKEKTND